MPVSEYLCVWWSLCMYTYQFFDMLLFSHQVISDSAARQASLSLTISWSLPKFMSVELVMPSNHLILSCPLLPSVFPSIRVFSSGSALCIRWPKDWSFSISPSSGIQNWFPSGLTGLIALLSKGLSRVFSSTTVEKHQFFSALPLWHEELLIRGFPGKEPTCQCRRCKRPWVWSLGEEDPLEEGMATYSSFLVWEVPWTEDPGGLQSTGSQRLRHDWSDLARIHAINQNLLHQTVQQFYYSAKLLIFFSVILLIFSHECFSVVIMIYMSPHTCSKHVTCLDSLITTTLKWAIILLLFAFYR